MLLLPEPTLPRGAHLRSPTGGCVWQACSKTARTGTTWQKWRDGRLCGKSRQLSMTGVATLAC